MEDEEKGGKSIALKANEDDQTYSSNNEDEVDDNDEEIALIIRKFKIFYKKGFNNRGKKPPFKKGGQSSSLLKARCFECNSTDHLVADCPKAIEKEKGALEAKHEELRRKKKGKGLIGTWD
ncbi:hypothetical protein M9H77_03397 [Catharanthus roseus]|uniref:Uncharacterized protein n=1 Tax=Catharanthus roseus TaxID=4058 RepID=A0ACC0CBK5_CATRO|nr:hypothetical protein M9H77_03397 [Catharanthus roseus]